MSCVNFRKNIQFSTSIVNCQRQQVSKLCTSAFVSSCHWKYLYTWYIYVFQGKMISNFNIKIFNHKYTLPNDKVSNRTVLFLEVVKSFKICVILPLLWCRLPRVMIYMSHQWAVHSKPCRRLNEWGPARWGPAIVRTCVWKKWGLIW